MTRKQAKGSSEVESAVDVKLSSFTHVRNFDHAILIQIKTDVKRLLRREKRKQKDII